LTWNGGVPFGWNSWYAYGTSISYSNAMAVSSFMKTNLQGTNFVDNGTVYINLDSYWDNLSESQLLAFTSYCHSNGQKCGIYMSPFVYWNTADAGSNSFITGSTYYTWSSTYLRTTNGGIIKDPNGGIILDGTSPGVRQMNHYVMNYFASHGFDLVKIDFLSEGAVEGVHYDTNVTTGIQAYNQAMQYILNENAGRMFLSESIAPIFPYQYAHSRRIYCDAAGNINDTMNTMQAVNYGWWLNDRLYQFNDPDMMKFAGVTANENQSRLINCVISGTVLLNSDDLVSAAGQNLAQTCLTNAGINEVARSGVSFRPVEGNTGSGPSTLFVRQDGNTWYVAVFNYTAFAANPSLNLARMGIAGTYTAVDLWSGAISTVSGTTWSVSLGAKQAKLFRLGTGNTTAMGPVSQSTGLGGSVTLSTKASGTPPFNYVWKKDGVVLNGRNANAFTLNPVGANDAGIYSVEVTGGSGKVTNSAILTVIQTPLTWAVGDADWNSTNPASWKDANAASSAYYDGAALFLNDTTNGGAQITITANQWESPGSLTVSNTSKNYMIQGNGGIAGQTTALTKTGTGTLILATANSYNGPTTINGGVLQIGNG
ncbi:MAG TPA: autotransporter-associated beta strand repeat-containing protein, partial [Verrucomicrobiae bacterium]